MELRELLGRIAGGYRRDLGRDQSAVRLLGSVAEELREYVPVTHLVKGSTGVGGLPFVPWVAIFDPDETDSAQRGIYVVYLFAADMKTIYLSLNQGSDDLRKDHIRTGANENYNEQRTLSVPQQLQTQAVAILHHIESPHLTGLARKVDLRAPRDKQRPRNYEAGNIVAKEYDTQSLPNDLDLRNDLEFFLELYSYALDARRQIALSASELIAPREPYVGETRLGGFKPTDGSDYQVKIAERDERRSRKHVPLLAAFAGHLQACGYTMTNQGIHPRDLVAARDGKHWLIEVKVVHRGDGQQASREAVAQLLEYRRFCYPDSDRSNVAMLAVFSEAIGPAFVDHLESLGIASVWAHQAGWSGSPAAKAAGMC